MRFNSIQKNCPICSKVFLTPPSINAINCSMKCASINRKRKVTKEYLICLFCKKEFKNKHYHSTIKFCSKDCSGKYYAGSKNGSWVGDLISYSGIHTWVRKKLGTPTTCKHCGKTGLSGRNIDWANKDHSYKRNLTDWIRLCRPCHRIYDKKIKA